MTRRNIYKALPGQSIYPIFWHGNFQGWGFLIDGDFIGPFYSSWEAEKIFSLFMFAVDWEKNKSLGLDQDDMLYINLYKVVHNARGEDRL